MSKIDQFDAVVIGAGISGMYQLHRLRGLGLSARVFETGDGVGGTWYWNRYPGARFDSESYSYGYSFSKEILDEWNWTEHFSPQPENERYLNFVADKLDLKKDIQFNSKVVAARYLDEQNLWEVELEGGQRVRARFLITAIGILSAHQFPRIEGMDSFKGQSWHTARWPKEPVDLRGKRVGVIGTGATGVQVIQEVAKIAGQLTVFQLDPNWCSPLNNSAITEAEQKEIHASYPAIFETCKKSFGGFMHDFDQRPFFDVPEAEREAFFERQYQGRGFGIWLGNFMDTLTDPRANAAISAFMARKIRARVKDPKVAEMLIPKDHGFGTKRVPMETRYYEVYNQDNVTLVDLNTTPIERVTPQGIQIGDKEHALDYIIYATGFDAVTGAFKRIDIQGKGGTKLADKWKDGPETYLGMQVAGFPNMFMLVGPHNGATFCNIPRCIEQNVEWVSDCIAHMQKQDLQRIETTETAEAAWTNHVYETTQGLLFSGVRSWFVGSNTPGKKATFLVYAGGSPAYRQKCEEVVAKGYEGFVMS
ncbi:MAG: NAD(P)/FAD-dependent oxidoreductase [Polaromonas sp.]|uniref:flavin-containing monooxygenase n=1 Tax=Polaromonas sp. TaxID=1869339 RepID=UPI002734DE36|nr:NAD(P)/FAD-dependent oxidoreductase [Polaromonas sp.]MDP3248846.1 NAD(P)/FAD-dependent oxidoreductase [Polaromonas sp.]